MDGLLIVAPEDIDKIIIQETARPRQFLPNYDWMLEDIKRRGQDVPGILTYGPNKTYLLVDGETRLRCIKAINADLPPERRIPFKAVLTGGSAKESFIRSLANNLVRNDMTLVDKAHAARLLQDTHGMSDEEVCGVFNITEVYLRKLKKVAAMPVEDQKLIHNKEVSFDALSFVREYADPQGKRLPEEVQKQVLEEAKASSTPPSLGIIPQIKLPSLLPPPPTEEQPSDPVVKEKPAPKPPQQKKQADVSMADVKKALAKVTKKKEKSPLTFEETLAMFKDKTMIPTYLQPLFSELLSVIGGKQPVFDFFVKTHVRLYPSVPMPTWGKFWKDVRVNATVEDRKEIVRIVCQAFPTPPSRDALEKILGFPVE